MQQQRRIVQLEDELQRAWSEIDRLRQKIAAAERDRQRTDDDSSKQPRYWTPDEHRLFMEAVQRYGWKDVKAIAQHVGTRTPTQVRTHAQKLFLRQQKESSGMMAPSKNGRSDLADMPPMPIVVVAEGMPPIPIVVDDMPPIPIVVVVIAVLVWLLPSRNPNARETS